MIIVRPMLVPLIPMGVDKSGTQNIPASSTTKVTGWVERSGFPGTNIANDEIVVNGSGNITIQGSATLSSSSVNDTVHIYRNGVSVGSATGNFNSTKPVSWTGDVNSGDSLALVYQNSSGFARSLTSGFLYFTINS